MDTNNAEAAKKRFGFVIYSSAIFAVLAPSAYSVAP